MSEFYQQMKPVVVSVLSLSKDAIHMHVGFLAYLLAWFFLGSKVKRWVLLVFPITLSVVMELLDMYADYNRLGRFLCPAYLHDLLNTNAIPVLVHFFLKHKKK